MTVLVAGAACGSVVANEATNQAVVRAVELIFSREGIYEQEIKEEEE